MIEIEQDLIKKLQNGDINSQPVADELIKLNKLIGIDDEMVVVRARRILDLIIRHYAISCDLNVGTIPLDNLITSLVKLKKIPIIIERYIRIIKDFGNLAAHGTDIENPDEIEFYQISGEEVEMCVKALNIIITWYYEKVIQKYPNTNNFEVVSGTSVTYQMIDQAIEIDELAYNEVLRGRREICYSWYDRNPDIYIMLKDASINKIIGYINAMPLEYEIFQLIENGTMIDMDIKADMIRTYDLPDFYSLYFCSIVVHPLYRNTLAFKILYDAFIGKLYDLAQNEIYFSEILADAVSEDGEKLCKYAGFKLINNTIHNSKIYKSTLLPPALRTTTTKGKRLLSFYENKYNEYKDLL